MMLTMKQRDLLQFIIDTQNANNGLTPSFDEMKAHLGLKSKSGIHRIICALEERYFIERLPYRARAIRVMRGPLEGTLNAWVRT